MDPEEARRWATVARAIIDDGDYMTLATADEAGRPWASPVWYATVGYDELIWLSRPEARHSRNLAVRRELGIVIYDSSASIGLGQGAYVEAVGEQVPESELGRCVDAYSRRSVARGGEALTVAEVSDPAPHRLYRALASGHSTNGDRDERVPVSLDLES
jgi:nitroimidazol reductase NimA-like FMN-containing flavoprotein (pyridoxamine 5'-phosphate oxidase superfamily)